MVQLETQTLKNQRVYISAVVSHQLTGAFKHILTLFFNIQIHKYIKETRKHFFLADNQVNISEFKDVSHYIIQYLTNIFKNPLNLVYLHKGEKTS